MAIASTDIVLRLSGGASNTDPAASLGGAKSSTAVTGSAIFDKVSSDEAAAGDTEYRCVYVHNAHATLTLTAAKIFIPTQTTSADTSLEVGVGAAAINATETAVANESTAPSGVSFSAPATKATGLSLGDIPPGQHKAIWIKRVVNANAAAANDSAALRVSGDTLP